MSLTYQRPRVHSGAIVAVVMIHAAMFYAISSGLDVTKIVQPLESMVTVMVPENKPAEPPPPMPKVKVPDTPLTDIVPPDPLPVEIAPEVAVPAETTSAVTTTDTSSVPVANSFSIQSRVDPLYPAASRRAGEEGTVLLELIVGPDGRPTDVKVTRSSGYAALDQAAITAVRKWRFSANSGSAYSRLQLPVTFRLENAR